MRDLAAMWLAIRDSRTPILAKALGAVAVAYALSPIDLVPDFIPVIGLLDDVLIVPLALYLAVRAMPGILLAEFRAAATELGRLPVSRTGILLVGAVWGLALGIGWLLLS